MRAAGTTRRRAGLSWWSASMSNCQELWIEGDQAAAFFPRFFCGSHCTPSSNRTPARTSGTSSAASTLRQCPSATCSSLNAIRSEEHTSELQSHSDLVCRLLLEKKKKKQKLNITNTAN